MLSQKLWQEHPGKQDIWYYLGNCLNSEYNTAHCSWHRLFLLIVGIHSYKSRPWLGAPYVQFLRQHVLHQSAQIPVNRRHERVCIRWVWDSGQRCESLWGLSLDNVVEMGHPRAWVLPMLKQISTKPNSIIRYNTPRHSMVNTAIIYVYTLGQPLLVSSLVPLTHHIMLPHRRSSPFTCSRAFYNSIDNLAHINWNCLEPNFFSQCMFTYLYTYNTNKKIETYLH